MARTLRRLREEADLTIAAAASEVTRRGRLPKGLTQYTLARYESGKTAPPANAVRELAAFYEVDEATLERMLSGSRDARQARTRVTLHQPYQHHFQAQINGLAQQATSIRALTCTTAVAGLLQTDAYAGVLASRLEGEDRDRWLAERARTRAVVDDETKQVTVVTTEGPLRYPLGGPDVMREQIDHIIDLSRRPNVSIGVLSSSSADVTSLLQSDATIYRLPDGPARVVYGVKDGTVILGEGEKDRPLVAEHEQTFEWASERAVWGEDARTVLAALRQSYPR